MKTLAPPWPPSHWDSLVQSFFYNLPLDICIFIIPIVLIMVFAIMGLKQKFGRTTLAFRPWSWWCLCIGIISTSLSFLFSGVALLELLVFPHPATMYDASPTIYALLRSPVPALLAAFCALLIGPSKYQERKIQNN